MIGQCGIDERLLPVEGFRRGTARDAISVKIALDDFGKKFRHRSQDGKIREHSVEMAMLELLQQIGALRNPAQAA
jgi:hypothetical protein